MLKDAFAAITLTIFAASLLWLGRQRVLQAKHDGHRAKAEMHRAEWLLVVAGVGFFLALWEALAALSLHAGFARVPGFIASVKALWFLVTQGALLGDFARSGLRVLIGFGLSLLVGTACGIVAGTFPLMRRLLVPSASFMRYVPPTAFIAVLILYFGIGESHKYAVIFAATVFFNFQMTVDAVDSIDNGYWEMGRIERLSRVEFVRWVVLPGAGPRLWDMMRVNLSFAWTFLTAAELVASDGGLGTVLTRSQRLLLIEDVFAVILFFGVLGVLTDQLLNLLGRRLFPWYAKKERA